MVAMYSYTLIILIYVYYFFLFTGKPVMERIMYRSLVIGIWWTATTVLVKENGPLVMQIRNKIRNYFPRPNETRRVRRHGWEVRMSTPGGRKVIMKRILKGRHVLTH